MYEKEQEKCCKVEDHLIEQYKQNADIHKQNADIFKQLLEKEFLRNEEISKKIEILNKNNMQRIFEELKRELTKNLTEVNTKEMLERECLINKENVKQNF